MPSERFVLITGASRGLGRSVALALAQREFVVFAGVRRTTDGNDLVRTAGAARLRPIPFDVTDRRTVDAAFEAVRAATAGTGLYGLINNAALFAAGPLEQTSDECVEELFRVNVFGVITTTRRFLPLVRAARGRVVNISAVNGRVAIPFTSVYSASKAAVEALSDALRSEVQPFGIHVSVVEPGTMRTDIRARGLARWTERRRLLGPDDLALYAAPYAKMRDLMPHADANAADHQHVVDAVYDALTADTPKSRYLAGPDTAQWMAMAAMTDAERDVTFAHMLG